MSVKSFAILGPRCSTYDDNNRRLLFRSIIGHCDIKGQRRHPLRFRGTTTFTQTTFIRITFSITGDNAIKPFWRIVTHSFCKLDRFSNVHFFLIALKRSNFQKIVSKFPPKCIHKISSSTEVNKSWHFILLSTIICCVSLMSVNKINGMLRTGILLSVVLLDVVAQQGFCQTFLIINAFTMSLSMPRCNKLVCSSLDSLRKGFTLMASI
jgi:hypothetical protein